jgi:sporulation protein YlmC with PRC-barrel domain
VSTLSDEERDVRRQTLMGRRIFDITGERVGRVVDTWPYDGGGEVEMAVVRMPRLGEARLVPVRTLRLRDNEDLVTPYSRWQVEDSPALEEGRHALAAEERAVSYWSWEEPDLAGTLTRRWQRSSGYYATARRSPTTPSQTTTAS